jgi:hypothetical protein
MVSVLLRLLGRADAAIGAPDCPGECRAKLALFRLSRPRSAPQLDPRLVRYIVFFGVLILAGRPALSQEAPPGLPPITVNPSGFEAGTTGSSRIDALLARRLRESEQFRPICRGCARGEAPRPNEMFYPFQTLGEARIR